STIFISPRLELRSAQFTAPRAPLSPRLEHHHLRLISIAADLPSSSLSLPFGVPSLDSELSVSVSVVSPSISTNLTQEHYTNDKALELEIVVLALVDLQLNTKASSLNAIREKYKQHKEERDAFSVYCKRGRREHMEDRYSAADNLRGQQKLAFFGIFDGHGGAKAAKFVANNLEKNVLDEVILTEEDSIEEAVKHGYVKTDSAFLKSSAELLVLCLSCSGTAPPILPLLLSSQRCSSSSQIFYNLLISSRHAFVIMIGHKHDQFLKSLSKYGQERTQETEDARYRSQGEVQVNNARPNILQMQPLPYNIRKGELLLQSELMALM
ncbi:hypothetical protein S245_060430, partial [Arachis hypogaea]